MTRVEWTRYEGNDVEAVVAMMINRDHPNSVRITPSRGDGGVDILDRKAGPEESDIVYQVKRYTGPLDSKQKADVEESLDRLLSDERWASLDVRVWILVTPWDPTPEAENWLQQLGANRGLVAHWRGLTHVDGLAASYPEVIDYYLHGGATLVADAYQAVIALIAAGDADLTVPALADRLQRGLAVLKTDPHYRYEPRFGEGVLPSPGLRPGLVMTWISQAPSDGPWVMIDVIARCEASLEERPITISGHIKVEPGSDFHVAIQDFFKYGAPFQSPEGAFSGDIDAPGGLGGSFPEMTVQTLDLESDLGEDRELHVEILDPDGSTLAAADLLRVQRTSGTEGIRIVLEEVHHVFTVEDRFNSGHGGVRRLTMGRFEGEPVSSVEQALRFLTVCHAPNVGRLSRRGAPPERGTTDPSWGFSLPPQFTEALATILDLVRILTAIQGHTGKVIKTPDIWAITARQVDEWRRAVTVLEGVDVVVTYPEGQALTIELPAGIELPDDEIGILQPFGVVVGTQEIELGEVELWLKNYTLVGRKTVGEVDVCTFTVPERRVIYRKRAS